VAAVQRKGQNAATVPLIDEVGVAAVFGLSTRKLRAAYAGNCCTLRRGSDDAESDFGFGADGWLDAAAIATWLAGANGYLKAWHDQSGNGNDYTQADPDKQWLYVAQTWLDGRPGFKADGADDSLTIAAAVSTAAAGTLAAVYALADLDTNQDIFTSADEGTDTSWLLCRATGATAVMDVSQRNGAPAADRVYGSTAAAIGTPYRAIWKSDGTAYALRLNSAAEALTVGAGANTGDWLGDTSNRDNCTIGALKRAAESAFFSGWLSEILLWDSDLTGDALTALESNQAAAWSATWDRLVIAGQSNAMGFGLNNQSYSHATLTAYLFGNDYALKEMADPTDSNTGQVDAVSSDASAAGSAWPLLATSIIASRAKPCLFVPCAKSASAITDWLPGADHEDRTTLYGSMVYRAKQAGGVAVVLWHQGEADALAGMAEATYNGHLDTIANAIATDLGCALMACKLQDCSTAAAGVGGPRDVSAVNAAIATAWADNANVLAGPDFSDIVPSVDGLHFRTDAELATAASRWWTAIQAALGW